MNSKGRIIESKSSFLLKTDHLAGELAPCFQLKETGQTLPARPWPGSRVELWIAGPAGGTPSTSAVLLLAGLRVSVSILQEEFLISFLLPPPL